MPEPSARAPELIVAFANPILLLTKSAGDMEKFDGTMSELIFSRDDKTDERVPSNGVNGDEESACNAWGSVEISSYPVDRISCAAIPWLACPAGSAVAGGGGNGVTAAAAPEAPA
jgi:hypothetical protein